MKEAAVVVAKRGGSSEMRRLCEGSQQRDPFWCDSQIGLLTQIIFLCVWLVGMRNERRALKCKVRLPQKSEALHGRSSQ
jgi:hypothetical protein